MMTSFRLPLLILLTYQVHPLLNYQIISIILPTPFSDYEADNYFLHAILLLHGNIRCSIPYMYRNVLIRYICETGVHQGYCTPQHGKKYNLHSTSTPQSPALLNRYINTRAPFLDNEYFYFCKCNPLKQRILPALPSHLRTMADLWLLFYL